MQSEVRLLIRLHNEGISVPKIWDVDLENGIIVMEKIQGTPLIEVLRDDSMSQDFVKNALISCGSAVRKLHRRAITHGDLSTNNILIDTNANASLIDFGLAAGISSCAIIMLNDRNRTKVNMRFIFIKFY